MTNTPGDTTIHIDDNKPVDAKRAPQLGDTHVHFGGEPFVASDTTKPEEMRPKGLAIDDSGSGDDGLGQILGGHASKQSDSPEKNILQTPGASEFSNSGEVEQATQASLSWTDGEHEAWMIRDEATESVMAYPTYAQADEYFDAHERTRWLIPGQDEVVGWKAAHPSGAAVEVEPAPGASAASDTTHVLSASNTGVALPGGREVDPADIEAPPAA